MADHLQRLQGSLAGRYVIERELGRGGMGTVYLAQDLKHDRQVALKVLHPELAAELGVKRFLREIQITAKLSHPHILPLYDSGEADGLLYYVMPYIEGESLADLLSREQQLPIEEAIRITREVAQALEFAHGYGVVHRDIKPENIMLSAGHAVVSDFGIARALSAAGGEKLTQTGMAVGTPAYMSPEQGSGATEQTDGRSDIYSLGCVLYEMLVGQVPFTAPTPQSMLARHVLDDVPRPQIVRQSIPDELEDVIMRALAKSAADRFRTAAEFAEALVAVDIRDAPHQPRSVKSAKRRPQRRGMRAGLLVGAAGLLALAVAVPVVWNNRPQAGRALEDSLDPRRVAVLYFDDLSADLELGYLADGLTESLIDELDRVPMLDVVSRNGVSSYRGRELPRDSIARALEAGTLLAGSVEPVADDIIVTVRLIDGASGVDFERQGLRLPAENPLAILDSLSTQVARLLRERLGEELRLRQRRAGTESAAAWAALQQGEKTRKEAEELLEADDVAGAWGNYSRADSLLASAEDLDSEWVEPRVLRGTIAYRRARLSFGDPAEADDWTLVGLGHAQRALELDPRLPEALDLRGTLRYVRWLLRMTPDPTEAAILLRDAEEDLRTAVREDPSVASAYSTLSHLLANKADLVGANLAARRAYEADAYLQVADAVLWRLYTTSYDLEYHADAVRWCAEGGRRFPEDYRFVECELWVMTSNAKDPDVDEAWRLLGEMVDHTPEPFREDRALAGQVIVAGVLARAGLADSARNVLMRSSADPDADPTRELLPWQAFVRTLLGNLSWWWRDIKDDPGFQELLSGSH
jgi:serine/threonine-protein kinase